MVAPGLHTMNDSCFISHIVLGCDFIMPIDARQTGYGFFPLRNPPITCHESSGLFGMVLKRSSLLRAL